MNPRRLTLLSCAVAAIAFNLSASSCGSNDPSTGTGGGSATAGGGSGSTGGGSAATGGGSGATGGGSTATGGGSASTGGGTGSTGGGSAATGGGSAATGGGAGSTGGGSATGGGGGDVDAGAFTPLCAGLVTGAGMTPGKNVACTGTDPQLCWKTCGPQSIGFKSETCTAGSYVEQSGCTFPADGDYACYAIPSTIDSSCPATTPQASQSCSVAECTLCNVGGMYLDSSGASKTGYCVCAVTDLDAGTGKWSCASSTAWPCPAGNGC